MGRAQAAYKQIKPEVREESFDDLIKALCQRFEPNSQRKLYPVEFQSRRKRKTKSWADFGDNFCALADMAFLKHGAEGREQLVLHQYLTNLSNPQVSFTVCQKKPNMVEGAVAAM